MYHFHLTLSLLTAFLSATPAFANCAWILWDRTISFPGFPGETTVTWAIEAAASTRAECEENQRAAVNDRLTRRWHVPGYRYTETIEGSTVCAVGPTIDPKREGKICWHYKCLPDTVDPRPPRGATSPTR